MKIEKLRKNHKKEIVIGTILVVVIGGALTYRLTHSKYRTTQSINLATGTINYTVPDFKIMAMYKSEDGENYIDTNTIPASGYTINTSKSSCKVLDAVDSSITINYHDGVIGIDNMTQKGTKCYLYFDKIIGITVDNIIVGLNAKSTAPDFSQIATDDEGVFETTDGMYDNGKTYYWRGAATTNHVIFAEKCWRIVRINGDKTLRLIYNGSILNSNKCTGNGANADAVIFPNNDNTDSSINLNRYATSDGQYTNPSYVGWKYELSSPRPASTTSGTDSNAKVQTQKWYDSNIGNNPTYSAKVAEGKYCNDRDVKSGQSWVSTGTAFQYATYERLVDNKAPTFNCSNAGDVYTLKAGLITADEVAFAGGVYGSSNVNSSYYLYNGKDYWTMSPCLWGGHAGVFTVDSNGYLDYWNVSNTSRGLRPVINLKADTTFASGGTGTQNNPYVVQ